MQKKNQCFIITNTECNYSDCKKNFGDDKLIVEKTFKNLNFEVISKENLKGADMEIEFVKLRTQNFIDDDCFVCVILSCCGTSGEVNVVYGIDGRFYSIDQMISNLSDVPSLSGKPKLFFMLLNRCKKDNEEDWRKAGSRKSKSKESDSFVYYSIMEKGEFLSFS